MLRASATNVMDHHVIANHVDAKYVPVKKIVIVTKKQIVRESKALRTTYFNSTFLLKLKMLRYSTSITIF